MKHVYFLILLMAVSANAFAQPRNCNVKPGPISIGTAVGALHTMATNEKIMIKNDGSAIYYFSYGVTNNVGAAGTTAADSFKPLDSLWIRDIFQKRTLRFVFTNTSSLKNGGSINIIPVFTGTSTHKPDTLDFPSSITTTTTTNLLWCDSVWAKSATVNSTITDPTDAANSKNCYTVEVTYQLVGINTINGDADAFILYPNPAPNGVLNMKFNFGGGANAKVIMRDVTGRLVLQRDMGMQYGRTDFKLDVSNLAPGMYSAELFYNDQRIVSMVNIK